MESQVKEHKLMPRNYHFIEITPLPPPRKGKREPLGAGASSTVMALDENTCEEYYMWEPEMD